MWSMSTSLGAVHSAPSYGDNQFPLTIVHDPLVVTAVLESRFRTTSRYSVVSVCSRNSFYTAPDLSARIRIKIRTVLQPSP